MKMTEGNNCSFYFYGSITNGHL